MISDVTTRGAARAFKSGLSVRASGLRKVYIFIVFRNDPLLSGSTLCLKDEIILRACTTKWCVLFINSVMPMFDEIRLKDPTIS